MIELPGYTIEREIGRGAFATVYLARPTDVSRHVSDAAPVAIKAVRTASLTRKLAEALAAEVAILRSIHDPHIIRLHSIERRDRTLFLVMEWCEGGDVAGWLRGRGGGDVGEREAALLVGQLAAALGTLRRASLVHRDIKPQNLLLSRDFKTLKLADFGFARYVEEDNLAETLCGSPLYMAPEILRYEKYDEKADLWSVGAVLYEMLFGKPPFRAQNHIQLLKVIEREGGRIEFPRPVSETAKSLLLGLLQVNPKDRLDFSAFLSHPFFTMYRREEGTGGGGAGGEGADGMFECRPIPIASKRSSLSSLSSSPKAGLLSATFSRRRSSNASIIPSSSLSASASSSSREQFKFEEEGVIQTMSAESQELVRRGIVLYDLLILIRSSSAVTIQLLAMQSLRFLVLGYDVLILQSLPPSKDQLALISGKIRELTDNYLDMEADFETVVHTYSDCVVSLMLYDYALKLASEGGFQELLGRGDIARLYYARSHFILSRFAPVPLSGQVIEEYRMMIEERLVK